MMRERTLAGMTCLFAMSCGHDEPSVPVIDLGSSDAAVSTPDTARPTDGSTAADLGMSGGGDAGALPECTAGPCPIEIRSFPYRDTGNTSAGTSSFDAYPACAPQDESGPEIAYVFRLTEPGTVVAAVDDRASVDVDIHLLAAFDAAACLRRDDIGVSAHLEPGVYYLTVDTFVGAGGGSPGDYDIFVDVFTDAGPCGMRSDELERIGAPELLAMPATGRVVLEAHLVTEDEFPGTWPTSITDGIPQHYALSQAASGHVMDRTEPWAPCCEPTNEFGQGSSARPPAIAEAWYINMRWRAAPARGERYIVVNPQTGKAVVAAAGYENGPGDTSRIGGACEEVHDVLGTTHLSTLTFGSALDQSLPYGPIDCH